MLAIRFSRNSLFHTLSFSIVSIILLQALNLYVSDSAINFSNVQILSVITTLYFFYSLYTISRVEMRMFSLTSILMLITYLFNFGQMFLWTFGIHTEFELGKVPLFSNFPTPSSEQIYNALFFSLYCYFAMVLGICTIRVFQTKEKTRTVGTKNMNEEFLKQSIYKVSILLGLIVVPLTFYKIFLTLSQSINYGYISLYYSDFSINPLIARSEDYFFPVIVGLLVGSEYKKIRIAYSLFALYMILYLLAGERGNWFYKLIILVYMHNIYYRKVSWRKFLRFAAISYVFLIFVGFIISVRNEGLSNISLNELVNAYTINQSPIIRFVQEMGTSLGITIMVMTFGRGVFSQFGNTYISSALTSFSSALATQLGINHVYLGNYLSQNLLKIRWGTGFNFFSEAFINGGWFGAIYLYLFGMLFGILINNKSTKLNQYSSPVACAIVLSMMRDNSLNGFRMLVQVLLFTILLIIVVKNTSYKRIST